MKHLSPDQLLQKRELAQSLQVAFEALKAEVAIGNAQLEQIREAVDGALERVNDLIAEGNALREEVLLGQEEFSVEQPEGWHSGNPGIAYGEWMQMWEEPIEALEVALPESMDDPELNPAELLVDLPERPEMPGGAR
ncbi:hypothetical protein [Geothrix sp. 21YS21S-2]|uniref:hypothetical protein n=1 Tax=Geothrix sp. 21YS21S-2 TaxID=3068893 RepID=UPI0027B8CFD2|nr:hypothetical protein [Geothrix sp. 21YS21S-2]